MLTAVTSPRKTSVVGPAAERAVVWGAARSTPGAKTIVDRLSSG
jgi:hypothetical protein